MDTEILAAARRYRERNRVGLSVDCQPCKDKMLSAMKQEPCPERPHKLFVCPAHKLIVSPRICKTCKRDTSFARVLFATYVSNRAGREKPCRWAGKPVGVEQVSCCNGEYMTGVQVYACAIHKKVSDPDCFVCKDYQVLEA